MCSYPLYRDDYVEIINIFSSLFGFVLTLIGLVWTGSYHAETSAAGLGMLTAAIIYYKFFLAWYKTDWTKAGVVASAVIFCFAFGSLVVMCVVSTAIGQYSLVFPFLSMGMIVTLFIHGLACCTPKSPMTY